MTQQIKSELVAHLNGILSEDAEPETLAQLIVKEFELQVLEENDFGMLVRLVAARDAESIVEIFF